LSYKNLSSVETIYLLLPPPLYPGTTSQQNDIITYQMIPAYKRVAARTGAQIIDVNAAFQGRPWLIGDGIHPTVEGYGVIAQTVYDAMVS